WNAKRRDAAAKYNQLLADQQSIKTPYEPSWSRAIYHLYVVVCAQGRDELQKHLAGRNIGTGLHYPIPVHLQKGYTTLGYGQGAFPVSEKLAGEILSLPMYPQIRKEQLEQVADALLDFYYEEAKVR